jgi:hypothetical protein
LTNTLKHAGPATPTAAVVRQRPDAVQLRVAYEGSSAEASPDQVRSRELPTAAADPPVDPACAALRTVPAKVAATELDPDAHSGRPWLASLSSSERSPRWRWLTPFGLPSPPYPSS